MQEYKILWSSSEYGNVIIKAENEEQAKEKFYNGDYKQEDINIKEGSKEFEGIETI